MANELKCKYCTCNLRDEDFGSDRICGFNEDGTFNPDNWMCPLLIDLFENNKERWLGGDGYAVMVPVMEDPEWDITYTLLLTRYKHRGTISSVNILDCGGPSPANIHHVAFANGCQAALDEIY